MQAAACRKPVHDAVCCNIMSTYNLLAVCSGHVFLPGGSLSLAARLATRYPGARSGVEPAGSVLYRAHFPSDAHAPDAERTAAHVCAIPTASGREYRSSPLFYCTASSRLLPPRFAPATLPEDSACRPVTSATRPRPVSAHTLRDGASGGARRVRDPLAPSAIAAEGAARFRTALDHLRSAARPARGSVHLAFTAGHRPGTGRSQNEESVRAGRPGHEQALYPPGRVDRTYQTVTVYHDADRVRPGCARHSDGPL